MLPFLFTLRFDMIYRAYRTGDSKKRSFLPAGKRRDNIFNDIRPSRIGDPDASTRAQMRQLLQSVSQWNRTAAAVVWLFCRNPVALGAGGNGSDNRNRHRPIRRLRFQPHPLKWSMPPPAQNAAARPTEPASIRLPTSSPAITISRQPPPVSPVSNSASRSPWAKSSAEI